MTRTYLLALVASASLLAACSGAPETADDTSDFSSNQATLMDFEFDGETTTDDPISPESLVKAQLLFTVGQLNNHNSVGRIDAIELSNVEVKEANKIATIRYHAKLPVAWGSKDKLPTTYDFILPRDMSYLGHKAFVAKYKDSCADAGAHDVDAGSVWYYFRPEQPSCELGRNATDAVRATAKVTKSTHNTTNKYPEYQQVWADNRLEVVAIFGKYEATGDASDAGVNAFNAFIRATKDNFKKFDLKTTPANVADSPGPAINDVTFEGKRSDGKTIKVTAFLVDEITHVPPGFDARYESLTETADVIAYNGHAGLGQNVRALATKGKWAAKKYQVFFMNGCDTFAYVDGSLAQTRAKLNPDDPTGTKYMEFITNAMPTAFQSMSNGTMTIMNGLLSTSSPKTYDEIFKAVDRSEVVLVTGEEDNVFQPGMPIGK